MTRIPSPFGESSDTGTLFNEYEEFNPESLPSPGEFLANHTLLEGADHVEFHETTRDVFEERGVYDMTFGYNLARLNLDTRHPDAGYRYAVESDDRTVLRAEFTPTTPFCPQTETLTKGSFRAWNDLNDRHGYELVRVRVTEMHHRSGEINRTLGELEDDYCDRDTITNATGEIPDSPRATSPSAGGADTETTNRDPEPDAPF